MQKKQIPCKRQFNKIHFPFIILISCFLFFTDANSQEKNRLGLTLVTGKTASSKLRLGFGVCFERFIQKHHSIETGVNYRSFIEDLLIRVPTGPNSSGIVQYSILQKFLTIPLLYKYNSRIINFSIGPSVDIYCGWEEKNNTNSSVPLPSYSFENKVLWGLLAKLSKTININKYLLIEPDVHYNPVFTTYSYSNKFSQRRYFGLAIAVKHFF